MVQLVYDYYALVRAAYVVCMGKKLIASVQVFVDDGHGFLS